MIASIYRIYLDVHTAHSGLSLDVKKADTGRKIYITLTDGGFTYQISEECYAVFTATKPDGNKIFTPCEIKGNTIIYQMTPQTTAVVGTVECEIRLYGADDRLITSPGFGIVVNETAYTEGDPVQSESEVDALTHLISEATTVITEGERVIADGEEINAESAALIQDMEAKRTELERQIADAESYAGKAQKFSESAAAAQQRTAENASWAATSARNAATSEENAQASEENAAASAGRAANMANAALQSQRAAEAAAGEARQHAEQVKDTVEDALTEAKESGQFDGRDGATYIPNVRSDGYLEWSNKSGAPNPVPAYVKGADGKSAYQYAKDGGYTGTEEEFAEMLANGTGSNSGQTPPVDLSGYAQKSELPTKVSQLENDKGYLTQHQDISGKLDASKLPAAINTALAQAKASGEFDGADGQDGSPGADGYTPVKGKDYFDGEDGNGIKSAVLNADYTLTLTFDDGTSYTTPSIRGATGVTGSAGKDGSDGAAGADGVGIASIKQTTTSTADGGDNVFTVTLTDSTTASFTIKNGSKGSTGEAGKDGKSAYAYAQDGGYTGTEAEFAAKLANEYNLNPLYGKKVSFLGDSICAGADTDVSYLGGYGKIIADRNNMVYENLAAGGATITAGTYSDSTGNPLTWLCGMVENMSADADYAIVEGGINDGWEYVDGKITIGEITEGYNAELDDTTFYGAFESMLKQLVTKFRGKKVGYIAIPKTNMWLYDSSRNAPNFYHIAMECCAKWGVPVCDLNTITPPAVCLGNEYMADAAHPTYLGYLKYYCDPIEAWMKTLTTGGNTVHADIRASLSKVMLKSDIRIKKAQLTLEDGSTVLIDVVVASEGTSIQKYTNQVPLSKDTDGSVFNGTGYQTGYRLSSSGVAKAETYSAVTGFIPAKAGDVVRIGGCGWHHANATNYLCAYKADHTFIGAVTANQVKYGTQIHSSVVLEGGLAVVTLADVADIAYIRVSALNDSNCEYCPAYTLGADMIVTINQEIG